MDIVWRPAPPPHAPPPPPGRPYAEPPLSPHEEPAYSRAAAHAPMAPPASAAPPFAPRVGPDLKTPATMGYALIVAGVSVPVLPLAGLALAYIKRGEARGTIYESHFRWQIDTFWEAASLLAGCAVLAVFGWSLGGGIPIVALTGLGLLCTGIRLIHRIAGGWWRLQRGEPAEGPPIAAPSLAAGSRQAMGGVG